MSQQQHYDDPIIQQIERLLYMLKHQRTSGIDTSPRRNRPIRTWDEQTKHLRFADKVKLHRYPGGLANTTRWRRDQMLAARRKGVEVSVESDRVRSQAAHEAMAYSLDAERFLGSLGQQDDRGKFPTEAVDELAEQLLCWLEERGYQVVPLGEE